MYALRDLMGHCYVHFAFVFTLKESINSWQYQLRYVYYYAIQLDYLILAFIL